MCCEHCNVLRTVSVGAIFLFALAGCCLYSTLLAAGEVVELTLSHKQGVYQLKLEMILDAPFEDVHHVITDYVHIYRLNPSIVESEIMYTPDDSVVRIRTLVNDCILIFCREIIRVEDVRELETGDIYAVIVPQFSNVKSGVAIWQIQPLSGNTRINYNVILEPGFFVPPLIGSYIVKQKLHKEVMISFSNIERIARIHNEKEEASNPTRHKNLLNRIPSEHDNAN